MNKPPGFSPAFLIDESMPRRTVELLREHGFTATYVRDVFPAGTSDADIAAYAGTNHMALVTRDNDFGNILEYPPEQYDGIVVLQTPEHSPRDVVLEFVQRLLDEEEVISRISGRLVIVGSNRIRIRPPLPEPS